MASGAQPSVAVLETMDTEDRLDGRMELNTPPHPRLRHTPECHGSQRQSAHPRFRPGHVYGAGYDSPSWACPCLGLATLFLAPWLFPGPPVGNFTVTPPSPAEVGDRLVGPVLYTLEARAAEQWTFFDFSRGSVVDVPHQFGVEWDLAFQRHKILANGGATNPKGRGAILNLGAVAFDEVWRPRRRVTSRTRSPPSIRRPSPRRISPSKPGITTIFLPMCCIRKRMSTPFAPPMGSMPRCASSATTATAVRRPVASPSSMSTRAMAVGASSGILPSIPRWGHTS